MGNEQKKVMYQVINPDTKEVVQDMYNGDRILRKQSNFANRQINENTIKDFNKGETFVKLYDSTVSVLCKKLTTIELAIVFSLCQFVSYSDCMLRAGGQLNGKPLSMRKISDTLDKEYSSFSRQFNSLISKGIICKSSIVFTNDNTGEETISNGYFFNPHIFHRGKKIRHEILELFDNTNWHKFLHS